MAITDTVMIASNLALLVAVPRPVPYPSAYPAKSAQIMYLCTLVQISIKDMR